MRIKVASIPPLPFVKAWYSVTSASTVADLKTSLCADLPPFQRDRINGRDIILVLDDFDLLNASPVDVIRDGDLIVIKRNQTFASNKRKSSVDAASPTRKRTKRSDSIHRAQRANPRAASRDAQHNGRVTQTKIEPEAEHSTTSESKSESGSSSSESESESDSSSSSESGSDSGSDPDSDDTSSEDSSSSSITSGSLPSVEPSGTNHSTTQTSKTVPVATPGKAAQSTTLKGRTLGKSKPVPCVPPGLGKSCTHSRNLRRRRKRMYERLALSTEPASVNAIPLGMRARNVDSAHPETAMSSQNQSHSPSSPAAAPPVFMMASLHNKNKKKGFKNALSSTVPAKIVFSTPDEDVDTPVESAPQALQEALPYANAKDKDVLMVKADMYARLVTPSEKQERGELPPNMFVTSVDVEDGLHSKRRKKKTKVQNWNYEQSTIEVQDLPYDDPQGECGLNTVDSASGVTSDNASVLNPEAVQTSWNSLAKVTEPSQLTPGIVLGWKVLGINPNTLTPEMLLHLGRVIKCDAQLTIEPFLEHGLTEVSFGGLVEAEMGDTIEVYDLHDVFQGDWRLIQGP
ncbi:hypothetical protein AcV7_007814 [Taiwanofungus camphoratus]|nr:hypothetical protein AcV7_007814 [Antrodia cinnamomea]